MSWFRRSKPDATPQNELFAAVPVCLLGILRVYGHDPELIMKTRWMNGYLLGLVSFLQENQPALANPTCAYLFEYLHGEQGKEVLRKALALHALGDAQVTDGIGTGYPDGSRCYTRDGTQSLADTYSSLVWAIKTKRIDKDQVV